MLAAKEGGANPDGNFRLRLAIDRARNVNMPRENIQRAIERATAGGDANALESIVYEGYGPGGVSVMVEVATDNRNRTVSEIRSAFTRHGAKLGESGSVQWIFEQRDRPQHRRHRPRTQRTRRPLPLQRRPDTQLASIRGRLDRAHRGGHPGEPALHRPPNLEPATHRPNQARRPGRNTTMEPTRQMGDFRTARAPRSGQRGNLSRCARHPCGAPERRRRSTHVRVRRTGGLRHVPAADGLALGAPPARLPVPPWPHQRPSTPTRPGPQPLRPRRHPRRHAPPPPSMRAPRQSRGTRENPSHERPVNHLRSQRPPTRTSHAVG